MENYKLTLKSQKIIFTVNEYHYYFEYYQDKILHIEATNSEKSLFFQCTLSRPDRGPYALNMQQLFDLFNDYQMNKLNSIFDIIFPANENNYNKDNGYISINDPITIKIITKMPIGNSTTSKTDKIELRKIEIIDHGLFHIKQQYFNKFNKFDTNDNIEQLQKSLDDANSQIKNLQTELNNAKNDIEIFRIAIAHLSNELKSLLK
jgi:hypothetical protein